MLAGMGMGGGRTARRFPGAGFDVVWIGAFGWLAACLILLAIHGVLLVSPWNYLILTQEDGWVENPTAVAYLLAGALLFAAAWAEKRRFPRFVFLAGGAAMAFIAGEEISWGQRILGFSTPGFLSHNQQGEATFHNLPGPAVKTLKHSFHLFTQLLCLTTAAAIFNRKRGLLGVPLPSLPLLLALLSIPWGKIPAEHLADDATLRFYFSLFGRWQVGVLMLLAAWALFAKRPALALAAAAGVILCFSGFLVHRQRINWWAGGETMELLLSLFWLCYAAELLHGGGGEADGAAGPARPPSKPQANEAESFPLLPAVSWVALAGGAGLLALAHFNVRMEHPERPELEAALRSVRSANPDLRAEWDLHLTDGQLTYFKEPCDRTDAEAGGFFLHIFPRDEADLPRHRRQLGFENLDFSFFNSGAHIQGSCVAVASLPDHPIASIHTGQYDTEKRENLWSARLLMAE